MDTMKFNGGFYTKLLNDAINFFVPLKTGHKVKTTVQHLEVTENEGKSKVSVTAELYCTTEELGKIKKKLGLPF